MGNKRVGEESVRILSKAGTGSYQITLPIGLVRKLKWQQGQRLVVRASGKKIIIEDWQP